MRYLGAALIGILGVALGYALFGGYACGTNGETVCKNTVGMTVPEGSRDVVTLVLMLATGILFASVFLILAGSRPASSTS